MGTALSTAAMHAAAAASLLLLATQQAVGDWSGTGRIQCYGHVSTDVSTPSGGGYLGPEAMFFKPNGGAEFEVWAWDYHEWGDWPVPSAVCEGDIWYKDNDMGAGYCTPHMTEKGWAGCGYGDCVGKITCSNC